MSNIEKIKAEIERLKGQLIRGACAAQIEMETNCKDEAYNEVLAFIDSLPEDDFPKTKGWLARNKDESLVFCYHKPHRENSITQEWWGSCDADFRIYDDAIDEQFKDLKWEDEPIRVEFTIKRLDLMPEEKPCEDLEMSENTMSNKEIDKWVEGHIVVPPDNELSETRRAVYADIVPSIIEWGKIIAHKFYELGKKYNQLNEL